MSTPGLSIAVIGAGGFGAYHLHAIQALRQERGLQLVAVADPYLSQVEPARAHALTQNGARLYADYRTMLAQEDALDAVTIAAPIPYHQEMVLACLRRQTHVYLEKPPVPLIQQLEELIAADMQGCVSVGFQQIASPAVGQLKRWIVEGRLGEIGHVRVGASWPRRERYYRRAAWAGKMLWRDKPVFDGPATNALAHLIHNVMYLAGDGFDEFASPAEVRGELYRARPIESYDVASLRGRFDGGPEFSAALTHANRVEMPFQIVVSGSGGWARLSHDNRRLESSVGNAEYPEEGHGDNRLRESYLQFLDFVEGRRERPATRLRDTRGYVLTTNAMLLSSGVIHSIPSPWTDRYSEEGDVGYNVTGVSAAIEASLETGRLFSELGVPWAVPGNPVSLADVARLPLSSMLGRMTLPADPAGDATLVPSP